ncbi:MAG TPA: hypothetical protein VER77_01495 [Candidatus Dormibacteraeota bacterium]|nr:hypothetical protein [Candidatus Dormibacteraeota bacterium]
MPNVMGVLRAEIRRLARKETRQEIAALKKHVNSMRRRVAESRRRIRELESRTKQAGKRGQGASAASNEESAKQVRFSPAWVKRHRSKLGMSRRIYAKLLSVSPQTIMGWESGRTRPRRSALKTWREIRGKGVRELRALVTGEGRRKRRGVSAKKARRKLRVLARRVARGAAARRATGKRGAARRPLGKAARRARAKKK